MRKTDLLNEAYDKSANSKLELEKFTPLALLWDKLEEDKFVESIKDNDNNDLLKFTLIKEDKDKVAFCILTFVIIASSNIDEVIITPYILPRLKLALTKFESLIVEEVKFTSSKLTFVKILFSIFVVGISVLINVEMVYIN